MEETTQQITQKPHIPIKTKIAAWWMIGLGIIVFFSASSSFLMGISQKCEELAGLGCLFGLIGISIGILFILPQILLLTIKEKWVWFFNFFILSLFFILFSAVFFKNPSFLIYWVLLFVPLLLLLLDRTNFWKIAKLNRF
jgi:hypothetical protein